MSLLTGRNLLVVEDDELYLKNFLPLLNELELNYQVALTIDQARLLIDRQPFDFMLTDLHIETRAGLDEPDGFKIIAYANEQQPNITIVANSSDPRTHIWEGAHKAGAQQFLKKPIIRPDELVIGFGLARNRKLLISKYQESVKPGPPQKLKELSHIYDGIVIEPKLLQSLFHLARKKTITGIFVGETGTGKEELAKIVYKHRVSLEGPLPFVAVNCATITENLAESQLFGHYKGSFTGAEKTTEGFIGKADGGILFLDEVHTLSIPIQQKLLRVLNDGTYNRLGESRTYHSRFQLLVATTKDLDDEAEAGRFLTDLRGRISGFEIKLPPLRERKQDIPALCALFLARNGIDLPEATFFRLCQKLQGYYLRSNVRQLFKLLEGWLIRCELEGLDLDPDHIPFTKGLLAPQTQGEADLRSSGPHGELFRELNEALQSIRPLSETLDILEKHVIAHAVSQSRTLADAAENLQISRSSLDMKRKKYQLN